MGLFTFGFFASHSVASSWVGRRAQAPQALASAIYLFFYYLGSSVIGSFCGVVWSRAGWAGVVGLLGATLVHRLRHRAAPARPGAADAGAAAAGRLTCKESAAAPTNRKQRRRPA